MSTDAQKPETDAENSEVKDAAIADAGVGELDMDDLDAVAGGALPPRPKS